MVPSCRSRRRRRPAWPARRCRTSKHQRRVEKSHLPKDAPNILIILLDDVGFGLPDTYGGPIHTPTLTRIANSGISYNAFHTTAICSPTRAALLTGRNHHRVGNGTIAERALDWDGYTGVIPQHLRDHRQGAAATTATRRRRSASGTTRRPPKPRRWGRSRAGPPARGIGFDYFYGFLAGETSQWEPRLVENFNPVEPPHDEKYHLTEDLADKAIDVAAQAPRLRAGQAVLHVLGPRRRRTGRTTSSRSGPTSTRASSTTAGTRCASALSSARRNSAGSRPNTKLTPRADTMAVVGQHPRGGAAVPAAADGGVRRVRRARRRPGRQDHRRAGAPRRPRQHDRLLHLRRQRLERRGPAAARSASCWRRTTSRTRSSSSSRRSTRLGGLDALGGPKIDNMYHAGWAWAGDTPFQHTKLVASHFGGTRNPMAISWPKRIKADKTPRPQFHHVNDIAPTIYEVLGIKPPKVVDGFKQDPIDGVSMVYTFADAEAPRRKTHQYFENNGSRGIYHDGWYACAFGPLVPWDTAGSAAKLKDWDANKDVWELYDLREGLLAGRRPRGNGARAARTR